METRNSSERGCLWAFAISISVVVFAFYLFWNVPVGDKTRSGNDVVVGDYVLGPLTDLKRAIFREPQPEAATRSTTEPRRAIIDAHVFEILNPGVTTYAMIRPYIGPGELRSSNRFGDIQTEERSWKNADGSVVVLMFQNGVLVSKSQHGLQ